jgi:hypothetical protein
MLHLLFLAKSLALEGLGPGLQVCPEGEEAVLLLLDAHLPEGQVVLSVVEGGLLVINRLCHSHGSVDGVTSRPLLQFHLLLLPDHRPLQGGNRDLPIKSPTDLLVEGLALLHELGPFLGGAGGHHLDAVP